MTTKKERGKQRKEAKNLAAINGVDNIPKTVALIRKGDNDATVRVDCDSHTTQPLKEFNGISYEQSGILSTVLKFLKRCEDDTFVKVMLDVGGGNLKTPATWIRVLMKANSQEDACRLHIAQNIGPLVRCMCDDTTRFFFESSTHWRDTMYAFVCLINNVVFKSVNNSDKTKGKEIIDTLLQYEGLLTSIVQWGFWNENYRLDITRELNNNAISNIIELGTATLIRLIKAADTQTEEGRKRLETIGTTPIISKEYDPECTISFVVGLIRQRKVGGWTTNASTLLRLLIGYVSCVDKDVITELIGLGCNTIDDDWVAHVAELLHFMIPKKHDNEKWYPNDTRAAFAIRGGLIELCLTFIERFGLSESFDKKKDNISSLFVSIKMILTNIFWVVLHKKTAKAIRNKRYDIERELARLEQNAKITNNDHCKKVLDMVRAILDLNGSYCCRCNKSLSRTEVKLCNGCHRMSYCSRACQKEDWFSGHSQSCCKSYTDANIGQFQGRFQPIVIPIDGRAATKLKELEINLSSVQLKLFLDHSETILSQASSLGIPLYDCIVRFDLIKCPLVVTTHEYPEFYNTPSLKREFEESRSKDNITCFFVSCIYNGSLVEGQIPNLEMQRLFPHEWLSCPPKEIEM